MRRILSVIGLLAALTCLLSAAGKQVICIDPGHISEVGAGTRGKHVTELEIAWEVALKLKAKLLSLGYDVVMTKHSLKEYVTNKQRAEVANEAKADYMVRLHCDASNGSGFASYYPAVRGTAYGVAGPSPLVLKMSLDYGRRFHAALGASLKGKLRDNGLKTDAATAVGSKHGGALIGSIYSKVPVVLIEMVVLTNPKDEAFIASPEGQDAMADGLAAGVQAALHKG
jgi:N-acetylmuramoyl-L-alanine amidase